VREIFPHTAAILLMPDETGSRLVVKHTDGENSRSLRDASVEIGKGVAGLAFLSGEVELAYGTKFGHESANQVIEPNDGWSVAVPLIREGKVFAIFKMFTSGSVERTNETRELLDAIGERISPLFLSSFAYERSVTDALTDPLTKLPNERALFMVLENQLAESQRFRDERPLSVLAVEISDFDEANEYLGAANGEKLVKFTGETLRNCLRKMDFLARTVGDEFVIILPTANETTTREIIDRIKEGFAADPFRVSEHESLRVWLNFGAASFWGDGETAQQLLRAARLKKQQAGAEGGDNVLWFDKDYVN
jgi:diguanylate cyclase (GGDEF)-like protein